jgi:hypothetical protein
MRCFSVFRMCVICGSAVYGPPIVGAQSHLAVEKVAFAAPSLLLFVTRRCCPQCLDYLNAHIGKQGAQSSK